MLIIAFFVPILVFLSYAFHVMFSHLSNYQETIMTQTTLASTITAFQDKFIPTIPEETFNLLMSELQTLITKGMAETGH